MQLHQHSIEAFLFLLTLIRVLSNAMPSYCGFDPDKDVGDLSGKVILVTGGELRLFRTSQPLTLVLAVVAYCLTNYRNRWPWEVCHPHTRGTQSLTRLLHRPLCLFSNIPSRSPQVSLTACRGDVPRMRPHISVQHSCCCNEFST